ncbi:threonine ammonia-lyase [Hymenobacter terrenus]|uniref:threonine ammonia-lyase n=1 Tax=Hymenobacter terrenus TaxID=1629124 RepID=UPI0006197DB9|nr:threonine/serine dehydratase [Hymenobacter terrenus]
MQLITLTDIEQAQQRVRSLARHTPLLPMMLPELGPEQVYLKPENLQPIGSFKIRGAGNRLMALTAEERARGVLAYSSGNHAQGVAYAARQLSIRATIIMPTNAPRVKIENTRALGAEVVLYDPAHEKREVIAAQLLAGYAEPPVLVPPFDDAHVIAGQGTVGLEIFADLPAVELVLAPVGGGGLLSGVAAVLKALKPSVKVVGVEPELAADAQESLRAGRIIAWTAAQTSRTLADGVRTLAVSELTFAHLRQYADDIVTVSEAELRAAARRFLLEARLVVEPTAALTLAALLRHRATLPPSQHTVLIISGGNADPATLTELLHPQEAV